MKPLAKLLPCAALLALATPSIAFAHGVETLLAICGLNGLGLILVIIIALALPWRRGGRWLPLLIGIPALVVAQVATGFILWAGMFPHYPDDVETTAGILAFVVVGMAFLGVILGRARVEVPPNFAAVGEEHQGQRQEAPASALSARDLALPAIERSESAEAPRAPVGASGTTAGATHPCPCCGYLVFKHPPGSHEVCPICFWEDDASQLRFARMPGGANRMSLRQAQQAFQTLGASEERVKPYVRVPLPQERREASWRPLDPRVDSVEELVSGTDYGSTYPSDPTTLYYWRPTYFRGAPAKADEDPGTGEDEAEKTQVIWWIPLWLVLQASTALYGLSMMREGGMGFGGLGIALNCGASFVWSLTPSAARVGWGSVLFVHVMSALLNLLIGALGVHFG